MLNFYAQVIWNNSNIKVDYQIFFCKHLFDKGLIYVKDLFDDNGVPFTYNHFCRIYDINDFPFTRFWGIIAAIPRLWRRSRLNTSQLDCNIINALWIQHKTAFSQYMYTVFINKLTLPPTSIAKWDLAFPHLSIEWDNCFSMAWATVYESKIRYFQFRFLHRILPTNSLCFKMKIKASPLCTFCSSEADSLDHLFCTEAVLFTNPSVIQACSSIYTVNFTDKAS